MLSTHIYNQALNLAAENCRSAGYHGDDEEAIKQVGHLVKIMEYGHRHGLVLDSNDQPGASPRLYFRRNGYRPDTLHINIE